MTRPDEATRRKRGGRYAAALCPTALRWPVYVWAAKIASAPAGIRDHAASVAWWDLADRRPDVAALLDPYRRAYSDAEAARVERGEPEVPADLDALRAALVVLGYRADMVADRARIRWTYAGEAGRNGPAFHRYKCAECAKTCERFSKLPVVCVEIC